MAIPGRSAKIKKERKRLQEEQERKQSHFRKIIQTQNLLSYKPRGGANIAALARAFSRYNFKSGKQTYLFVINECNTEEEIVVRRSACRIASFQKSGTVKTYVSLLEVPRT